MYNYFISSKKETEESNLRGIIIQKAKSFKKTDGAIFGSEKKNGAKWCNFQWIPELQVLILMQKDGGESHPRKVGMKLNLFARIFDGVKIVFKKMSLRKITPPTGPPN